MSLWTVKAHDLHAAQARLVADLARTADPAAPIRITSTATAAGDPRRLRGIPAIGHGVTGAIPGTSPHSIR